MARPIERNDSATFSAFLDSIEKAVDDDLAIHVILDNGSSRVSKATKAWFAAHPRWSAVPWLDDEEKEVWMSLVGVFMRLPAALDAQLRRDAGLSHFEYQVLAGLSMADGRALRMSDIADFAESSLSRLSHACRRLEAQGWLTREPDRADGRATVAALTGAGYSKVVEAAPGHVRTVRALVFDPLTRAQLKQLGEIASRIDMAIGPRLHRSPQ